MERFQSLVQHFRVVILPLNQIFSRYVILALDLRWVELHMVAPPTLWVNSSSFNSTPQRYLYLSTRALSSTFISIALSIFLPL